MINSKVGRKETTSDDVSAYELIMKNKELLLDRNPARSPVRLIFSHSALREGWDNPNVFQICTLKQSESVLRKRQEVGRCLLYLCPTYFAILPGEMKYYLKIKNLDFHALGREIKRKREEKGWTQEYLAQLVDRPPRPIMYIVHGLFEVDGIQHLNPVRFIPGYPLPRWVYRPPIFRGIH
ncbi:hypothetical protein IMSAGC019_02508 [Lachnospiraceae bacterium]|nr:hypothetical protein IMSAGC019_02508 [Lachnospiraceae bacterium]